MDATRLNCRCIGCIETTSSTRWEVWSQICKMSRIWRIYPRHFATLYDLLISRPRHLFWCLRELQTPSEYKTAREAESNWSTIKTAENWIQRRWSLAGKRIFHAKLNRVSDTILIIEHLKRQCTKKGYVINMAWWYLLEIQNVLFQSGNRIQYLFTTNSIVVLCGKDYIWQGL